MKPSDFLNEDNIAAAAAKAKANPARNDGGRDAHYHRGYNNKYPKGSHEYNEYHAGYEGEDEGSRGGKQVDEGVMSGIHQEIASQLDRAIKLYKTGRVDADQMGAHTVKVAQKLAQKYNVDPSEMQQMINGYFEEALHDDELDEETVAPQPKAKTVAKTWDQMTPKEKVSGVKGRTIFNPETRKYRTVFDVPASQGVAEASVWSSQDQKMKHHSGFPHTHTAAKDVVCSMSGRVIVPKGTKLSALGNDNYLNLDTGKQPFKIQSDSLEQGVSEGFDKEEFRRHMAQLRAREELRKTDPMKALVGDLIDKDKAARNVKKPQDDDSIGINDPRHPNYAYTQAGQQGLNEFAPSFGFGDDDEGSQSPNFAYKDGLAKGFGLSDSVTLERAMASNSWSGEHMPHFTSGFIQGRRNKIAMDKKQHGIVGKLMKDGRIKQVEQGVTEGWKDVAATTALGAAALGGIGAGIANSPMTSVKGHQLQMAMPGNIPSTAKLVTDDEGKKIYIWKPDTMRNPGMKGETQWVYRPADNIKENFDAEYDDEAGSAESNLHTITRAAQGLIDTIGENDNLPEWAQEKIAKVEGMLTAVWDYLISQEEQGIDPQVNETAAWRRKEGKNKKGGLNAKGVASYRRENPGSKLQTAVTTKPSKLKAGSKDAKRRKSFCARMGGMPGPMKDKHGKPTRKALALRKWHCESVEQTVSMLESVGQDLREMKQRLDPKCWKGKHKEGTKIKGGVRVNNCVPNESVDVKESSIMQGIKKV